MFKPVVGVCSICLIGLPLKVSGKETIVPVFDKPYKTNDILATDFIETYSSTFDLRHKSSFAAYTSGECVRYHTNCEAAGYFTPDSGNYCTTSEPSVSIYISNCSQTPCYEDCPTDVSTSCADFEDTPNSNPSQNNLYCKTTRTYYLDDASGDELVCGGDCVPAYADCEVDASCCEATARLMSSTTGSDACRTYQCNYYYLSDIGPEYGACDGYQYQICDCIS